MKSSKKALAFALAAAMVVTAFPVTNAEAASTAKLSTTKVTVAAGTAKKQAKNIVVTIPSTWKSYKVTASSSNKKVAAVRMCGKRTVKVTAVKKGSAKVTVKVTAKKGNKKVSKTLTAKASVINAGLKFTTAPAEVVIGSETKFVAKKCPSVAKVTFSSSDPAVATVDAATGVVKAVKAGKVTITATSDYGKEVTTDINVKKAIIKSATQTEYNKVEAVIVGDAKNIKAGDLKVTNTATKATVAVKSISAKKDAADTYVIETFTGMTDAKDYTVEYEGSVATFTATDNTVAKVSLTKTEVPAGIKTDVKAVTMDAKGVILGYFGLSDADSSKGKVTTALTITKGYVEGTSVYLPTVGDTMVAKVTYHTGTFASDGTETGKIEDTLTITAVDPSAVNYNYALTIAKTAPTWTAASFKANNAIKVGVTDQQIFFRITDNDGNEIDNYNAYTVETADPTKLVLNAQQLTKNGGVAVKGVSAADTYVLIKKDGNVVASLAVKVQGEAVATSVDLDKTSVTVMTGKSVQETLTAKLKDQYGNDMTVATAKVENLSKPDGGVAPSLTASIGAKSEVKVSGDTFKSAVKTGSYTYKITLANATDKKEITRTFTVVYVDSADVQSYQLSLPSEVDTTVKADTANTDAYQVQIKVVKMANGAAVADYTSDSTNAKAVTYTVKDKDGKDVSSDFLTTASDVLTVSTVTKTAIGYKKNLAAGTYYVTAKFQTKQEKADGSFTGDLKDVAVSGSFTIKDTQDTAASIKVKKNNLNSSAFRTALQDKTNYIEITYDGVSQTITASDIAKVNGTIAGNTAYVTSVEVYVELTDSASHNKVLITVPVNQTFTNVSGDLN